MRIRMLASIAVLVSAVVHLQLWFDVFRDTDVIGPAMLLNFVGGVVIAILVVIWRHWWSALLVIAFGVSTLGAFIISTTDRGLYGVHEHWTSWQVFTAAGVEVVAIIAGAAILLSSPRLPRH